MHVDVDLSGAVKVDLAGIANTIVTGSNLAGGGDVEKFDTGERSVDDDRDVAEQLPEKFVPEWHRRPELQRSAARRVLRDSWEEEIDEDEVKADQDDVDRRDEDIRRVAYQCLLQEQSGSMQLTELGVMIRSRLGYRVYGLKKILEDDAATFGVTNPRPSLFLVRLTDSRSLSALNEAGTNAGAREQRLQHQPSLTPGTEKDVLNVIREHATSFLLSSPHREAPLTAIGQSLMNLNLHFDGKIKDVLFSYPEIFALTRVGTTHWKVRLLEPALEARTPERAAENLACPPPFPRYAGSLEMPSITPAAQLPSNTRASGNLADEVRDVIRSFLRTQPDLEASIRDIRNHISGTGCIRNNESVYYAIKRYPNDFQLFKVDGEDWCARLVLDGGNGLAGCPRRIEEAVIEVLTQERRELKGNELSRVLADVYGIWCHNLRRLLESSSTRPCRFRINFMPRDATKWSIKLTRCTLRSTPTAGVRSTEYSRVGIALVPGFRESNGSLADARDRDRNGANQPNAQTDATHGAASEISRAFPLAPGLISLPPPLAHASLRGQPPNVPAKSWTSKAVDKFQTNSSSSAPTATTVAQVSPFSYAWRPMIARPTLTSTSEAPRPIRPVTLLSSGSGVSGCLPSFTATTPPPVSVPSSASMTIPSSPWSDPSRGVPGNVIGGKCNAVVADSASVWADIRSPSTDSRATGTSLTLLKQSDDTTTFDEIASSVARSELRPDVAPFVFRPAKILADERPGLTMTKFPVCVSAKSSTGTTTTPSRRAIALTRFMRSGDDPAPPWDVELAENKRKCESPIRPAAAEARCFGSSSDTDDGGRSDSGESSTIVVHAREGTPAGADGLSTVDSAVFESSHGRYGAALSGCRRSSGLDAELGGPFSSLARGTTVFFGDRRSGKTRSIHSAVSPAADCSFRGRVELLAVYRYGDIAAEDPVDAALFCRSLGLSRGADTTILVCPDTFDVASRLYSAGAPGVGECDCRCSVMPIIFSIADLQFDDVMGFLALPDFDVGFAELVEQLLRECFEKRIWMEGPGPNSTPSAVSDRPSDETVPKTDGPAPSGYWSWDYSAFREKLGQLMLTRATERDRALADARIKEMTGFLYETLVEKILECEKGIVLKAVNECTTRRFLCHGRGGRIIAIDLRNPNLPNRVASTVISMVIRQWAAGATARAPLVSYHGCPRPTWDRSNTEMNRYLVLNNLDTYIGTHPTVLRLLQSLSRPRWAVAGNFGVLIEASTPQPGFPLSKLSRSSKSSDEKERVSASAGWCTLGSILQLSDAVVIHRCSSETAFTALSLTGAASQAQMQEAERWAAGGSDLGVNPCSSSRCSLPPPLTSRSMVDSGISDLAWGEDEVLVWRAPERWRGGRRSGPTSCLLANSLRRAFVP